MVMVMVMDTGDRANASSEIEYRGAWGHLIGGKVRSMTTPFSSILSMNLRCMHVCMHVCIMCRGGQGSTDHHRDGAVDEVR